MSPPKNLAEHAYRELERMIVTAELEPGRETTESEIGAMLGISRTPVREAIRRLVRAKLIEIEPRRGLRVTPINIFDHLLLLRFRRIVELFITAEAARKASADDRRVFVQLAHEMETLGAGGEYGEHYRIDLEYKLHLLACARHEYAASAIEPMWAASRRFAWVSRASRDIPEIAQRTAETMRAVASGDAAETRRATDAFIDCLEAFATRMLQAEISG